MPVDPNQPPDFNDHAINNPNRESLTAAVMNAFVGWIEAFVQSAILNAELDGDYSFAAGDGVTVNVNDGVVSVAVDSSVLRSSNVGAIVDAATEAGMDSFVRKSGINTGDNDISGDLAEQPLLRVSNGNGNGDGAHFTGGFRGVAGVASSESADAAVAGYATGSVPALKAGGDTTVAIDGNGKTAPGFVDPEDPDPSALTTQQFVTDAIAGGGGGSDGPWRQFDEDGEPTTASGTTSNLYFRDKANGDLEFQGIFSYSLGSSAEGPPLWLDISDINSLFSGFDPNGALAVQCISGGMGQLPANCGLADGYLSVFVDKEVNAFETLTFRISGSIPRRATGS